MQHIIYFIIVGAARRGVFFGRLRQPITDWGGGVGGPPTKKAGARVGLVKSDKCFAL